MELGKMGREELEGLAGLGIGTGAIALSWRAQAELRRRDELEPFDQHESGQLRLGAAGDQLEVLPLEDGRVPVSDGGRLASAALEELTDRPDTAELERHSQWEVDR